MATTGAFAAITLSLAALVHDLGRPARFVNMLRVFKVTSPMSVSTWPSAATRRPRDGPPPPRSPAGCRASATPPPPGRRCSGRPSPPTPPR
jgi:hypothetical protein